MNVNQMYKSAGKSPPTADENYHVSIEQMVMDGVPLAALLSVKEDKNDICVYTAKACSPLLCADQFHPVEEEDYSLFEDEVVDVKPAIDVGRSDGGASSSTANQGGTKSGAINVGKNEESNIEVGRSDGGASASSKPPIDVGRSDSVTSSSSEYHTAGGRNERSNIFGRTKGASKDASSAQKGVAINSIPEKKEVDLIVMPDDSIRTILKKTLGNKCLLRNNGWWTYEFCHGKFVREYHIAQAINHQTGIMREIKEDEHKLGVYDPLTVESYPDSEEADYVINATSNLDHKSDVKPKQKVFPPSAAAGKSSSSAQAGGNGAVYVQEYYHGMVCMDEDVRVFVNNGVERATTVRFSCGKNYEILNVKEDSTCHYIFDVSVPDLCGHPLFKEPVIKTQVVKCLPAGPLLHAD